MHIEVLRMICDLAELRSFSKAAEKAIISQSAVSQQLAQLEVIFKCQLFDRKKRPIELTKAGQIFYEGAKDILERYDQLHNELKNIQKTAAGRINIAAIYSIGMHALPEYIKKFMLNYPSVNVHIEYHNADKIYEFVLAGDIDIGLVAIPKRDKRLDVYDFEDEQLVLACSPKHPLAAESRIDIHKIAFEKFIAFEQGVPSRLWIDRILEQYNISIRPVMEFDNIETIKRAIEINSGISILPKNAILQEISSGTIKAIDFSNETFYRPTGIIIRKGKIFSPASRYLIDLLRKRNET